MEEILSQIKIFQNRFKDLEAILDIGRIKAEISAMEKDAEKPEFWQNQGQAKEVLKKLEVNKNKLTSFENLKKEIIDIKELADFVKETLDPDLADEIKKKFEVLKNNFSTFEFKTLFIGQYDSASAILAIHAGAGGTDAQDWAEILLRMYLRFFEQMGFTARIVDESRGKEAGIKSVVVHISGEFVYGYLKSEAGVHRLVRISPFDAEAMRHTSFALVEVLPEAGETEVVKIDSADLKIDTFRSSGPGGQHVNKTESAIRLTHIPSGIIVSSQSERSQLQNRDFAMKILRAKLHQKFLAEKDAEKKKIRGEYKSAEWGNQIRSYIIHPYKLIKDHRTGFETSDIGKILDGGIIELVESYLKHTNKK